MTSQCNENWQNKLYTGDNLYILHGMNSESVDLIYLDPPFNSKRMYSAPIGSKAAGASFKDMWTWEDVDETYLETLADKHPGLVHFIESIAQTHSKAMMAYITYMTQRVLECHRILKDTGSLYFHCDPTASHYVKIMLDEIFWRSNFSNEIIWCYRQGGRGESHFARKHDIILFYAKNKNKNCFDGNAVRVSYEGTGGYVNSGNGIINKLTGKIYFPNPLGKIPEDWWDIPTLNPNDPERTGYPTQKPLALLDRIIKASCPKDGVVLDPFCGCATTCVAAQYLERKWIGIDIDIEKQSVKVLVERLEKRGHMEDQLKFIKYGIDFINTDIIPKRTDLIEEIITKETKNDIKKRLFNKQNGHCNACDVELEIHHFEIDHIIPKAKGGGDYFENYQLLCGSCNRIKGARPMDYLRTKIKTREKMLKDKIIFGE